MGLLRRFESAKLNQGEAAELLGVSERTFRRWTRRYEEEGEPAFSDRRLGKASGKRVPAAILITQKNVAESRHNVAYVESLLIH